MSGDRTIRTIAVDWSGALGGARRRIWLAEARDGMLVRLECGRDREELIAHLAAEAARGRRMIVGLDFAFSLPCWYLRQLRVRSAPELWAALAGGLAEELLRGCAPPFWGLPGRRRPDGIEPYRRTERETAAATGARPKSVFQVCGAGSVGAGSLRGMPLLPRLREAGFAIWPFDDPWRASALALEIYPRLLTGAVVKRRAEARAVAMAVHDGSMTPGMVAAAVESEDAFDAAVSALVMHAHRHELRALAPADNGIARIEGEIWRPRPARARAGSAA